MLPYAVRVPSTIPSGTHEIKIRYPSKTYGERVLTFEMDNPDYGKPLIDPTVEALKKQYPDHTVVALQQGRRCGALKIEKYDGCTDTYLSTRISKEGNVGNDIVIRVGSYGGEYNGLIRFDLSAVPESCKVEKAVLKLFGSKSRQIANYQAYKVLKKWGEGSGMSGGRDGRVRSLSNARGAAGANPGDASWMCAAKPEKWGAEGCRKPGTDRSEKPLSSAQYTKDNAQPQVPRSPKGEGWASWDITSAAADWVKEPSGNFGVHIDFTGKTRAATFLSSEDYDANFRPKLILVLKK